MSAQARERRSDSTDSFQIVLLQKTLQELVKRDLPLDGIA